MLINPSVFNFTRRRRVLVLPIEKWDCLIPFEDRINFDLITYSYSDNLSEKTLTGIQKLRRSHISLKTEFWGESMFELSRILCGSYEVYGFLNGDVATTASDLNRIFELGDLFSLDLFQPALSPNSYFAHPHTLRNHGPAVQEAPFVESIAFFASDRFLCDYVDLGIVNKSAWGIDCFLWPYILKLKNYTPPQIINAVEVFHCKPNESSKMRFSNGKTPQDEMHEVERLVGSLLKK
jgi:hypothetical protein